MTRISDKYDMQIGPDGKVRLVENPNRKYAKMPANKRPAARANAKNKQTISSRAKAQSHTGIQRSDS